jgi:hypothetical protein
MSMGFEHANAATVLVVHGPADVNGRTDTHVTQASHARAVQKEALAQSATLP